MPPRRATSSTIALATPDILRVDNPGDVPYLPI